MWTPRLEGPSGKHLYLQISDSLAADVLSGKLGKGERLPTVRELAFALSVTPGTINRAYEEASQRGLIEKTQGRGTFVRSQRSSRDIAPAMLGGREDFYDFTINQPTQLDLQPVFAAHLADLSAGADNSIWSVYGSSQGRLEHRRSVCAWLEGRGVSAEAENLFLLAGAQQGLLSSLMLLGAPGDTILIQETTFPGIRAAANLLGLKLQSVKMDEYGLDLQDFKFWCKKGVSRVFVVLPTAHNPTGKTLPLGHREKLVKIARKYDIILVEDDLYLHHGDVTAIQQLAPESTFHISGFSKCVAPALRLGTLLCPADMVDPLTRIVQAQNWLTSPLVTELAHRMIVSGDVDAIEQARKDDTQTRLALARRILSEKRIQYDPVNLHIWLKHSPKLDNAEVISRLNRLGVDALPSAFFHNNGESSPHIRLCLGNQSLEKLEQGLLIIGRELNPTLPERAII